MGAMMRAADWCATPMGPVSAWPQSLRTAISIMLESKFAMVVAWGPEYRFFYNDRYQPILGSKHPGALGQRGVDIFPEVWPVVGPAFDRVGQGEAFAFDDWLLPLQRNGYLESCWFTLSYSPIRDESGGVGGVLAVVAETTGRVEGERRLATLRDLARRASEAKATGDACRGAAAVFEQNPIDVPFALLYLLDAEAPAARLVSAVRLAPGDPAAPEEVRLDGEDRGGWPLGPLAAAGTAQVVEDLLARFGALPGGEWPEAAHTAVLFPLARPGLERPYGVLVAGVSPRRRLDDAYRGFFELAAEHITTALSNALAFEAERRRAEALAEIDRAKTAFFGNVSHEFRTPLTLMLGPLEDALAQAAPAVSGEPLRAMHRNALRLQKLVNALLDFSRIEAGRVEAVYEPTDLAAFSAELASGFRSAVERAGLSLQVAVEPAREPAWIDRQMWEKIVLNLLSNAFKFTFEGGIVLALRETAERFELEVRDTGTGIPAAEVPRLFERFHRVAGARSRTEEGSGIGLALVQELVKLHGGEIAVQSELGVGSCFRVSIPRGSGHLPAQRLGAARTLVSTGHGAAPYVAEALRWVRDDLGEALPAPATVGAERVLVADDNADMRDYLRRILGGRWQVEVVGDGAAALRAACERPPDLVLTDVMMPGLDGFALLRALREDDRTRHVPVVMLSARAGEEASEQGLQAGADDYLVKPFTARELLARVGSQLSLARSRAAVARQRAEADLQQRNVASLLMQAPTPICILRGPRLVVELANPATCRLWGRSVDEVMGKPLLEALPELHGQGFDELLGGVMATGIPYFGKERPIRLGPEADRAGTDRAGADRAGADRAGADRAGIIYLNFVYEPLRTVDGRVDGVIMVGFDVTDEVTAREQVDRLRLQAEAANRAKDEFLAMLSHELRNPMAPIFTAIQLLRLKSGDAFERELAILDRQGRHLLRLVEDLLDVSKLTRGKVMLRRAPVEIAAVTAHAVEMVEPLLEERRHHLVQTVPASGLCVEADAQRLAQVVANLLTNAARYTEPGGRIELAARAIGDEGDEVEIVVRDNGAGIAADLLPRLFEPFVQGPRRAERREGGLGLGLEIVRSLVTLHGGRVSAHSDGLGRGSTFRVVLPASAEPVTPVPAAPAAVPEDAAGDAQAGAGGLGEGRGRAHRVLLVDDNRDAADLLGQALGRSGYAVTLAYDGPSAITAAAGAHPDVALLDIGLPGMDGYEVARHLRGVVDGSLRLVAITGYGLPADHERSQEAGFLAHLTKPLDVGEVQEVLAKILAP
jgi:signal transduction histidine kinase/DNA-binding response OmpR family regulator